MSFGGRGGGRGGYHGGGGGRGGGHHQSVNNNQEAEDAEQKAAERNLIRKCIDYHVPAVIDIENRLYHKASRSSHARSFHPSLQPHSSALRLMGMPISTVADPVNSMAFCTFLAHVTRAKNSTPIMCLSWTPGGRRLLTGNQEGEFTLWDGITFGFELIMSAHDSSFRAMEWSHNKNFLLTCDAGGNIKYWSPSIAPVQSVDSHNQQAIHALSFSPSDTKFVSAGDDATVRVWDWASHREERKLEGHGWDVKCVQWHPRSSVICSGSKDNLVKLWDPRAGATLSTLYGHKNTVTKVAWNDNGNWLLTASRDQLIKLYDIRAMKELVSMKGHHKEVTSIAWHPLFENVFASGGMDGTLIYWNVGPKGSEEPAAKIPFAHDMAIWSLQWHPYGGLLATGSNDRQTKFWARNRLGSTAGLPDEDAADSESQEILTDEIELGNHVGIVIGRRGATIISMQRATGTKMHVDQVRRVLLIQGTQKQINTVKKRVHALLERVSSDERRDGMM
ncbi:end processing protein WDR33 [Seminavis robusta]|uniref:End processing protein WDR33 n=1 Tax=Seminavis robusta TaxID=568900 RepID=A0A9N8EIX0_9STRA|nr:end processing protein WDR33 [Seminavis robusta]|eukprot:Sro1308_g261450.1 end processing protein WDR33 (505) ;mRNA; r:11145-12760